MGLFHREWIVIWVFLLLLVSLTIIAKCSQFPVDKKLIRFRLSSLSVVRA